MDTKRNINETFRLAFAHLKGTKKGTLKDISEACGCSEKHLGNILSPIRAAGSTPEIKEKIAGYYGKTLDEMLAIGVEIMQGNLPVHVSTTTGQVTGSQQVSGIVSQGTTTISIINGKPESQDGHSAILSDLEFEVLTLFRKYGNPTMLERCLRQLREAQAIFG